MLDHREDFINNNPLLNYRRAASSESMRKRAQFVIARARIPQYRAAASGVSAEEALQVLAEPVEEALALNENDEKLLNEWGIQPGIWDDRAKKKAQRIVGALKKIYGDESGATRIVNDIFDDMEKEYDNNDSGLLKALALKAQKQEEIITKNINKALANVQALYQNKNLDVSNETETLMRMYRENTNKTIALKEMNEFIKRIDTDDKLNDDDTWRIKETEEATTAEAAKEAAVSEAQKAIQDAQKAIQDAQKVTNDANANLESIREDIKSRIMTVFEEDLQANTKSLVEKAAQTILDVSGGDTKEWENTTEKWINAYKHLAAEKSKDEHMEITKLLKTAVKLTNEWLSTGDENVDVKTCGQCAPSSRPQDRH